MIERKKVKELYICLAAVGVFAGSVTVATASSLALQTETAPIYDTNSWKTFAKDDGVYDRGFVDPGWGGQAFDAEYLAYKVEGGKLSIGLQTGFNLETGKVTSGSHDYYAGDLAISFDGIGNGFEYAIDFGFLTKDYGNNNVDSGSDTGRDVAGFYTVSSWNEGIYFEESNPFAMDEGLFGLEFSATGYSYSGSGENFTNFRWVELDISDLATVLGVTDPLSLGFDAHWTMSCGNDAIDGHAPVPEPATMLLFGTGLIGLAGVVRRRNKKKA